LIEGQQKSAVHRRRSPLGTLPVLELDDGSFLTESTVIIEYLEEPALFVHARTGPMTPAGTERLVSSGEPELERVCRAV
jgi:glutathione S-transferase